MTDLYKRPFLGNWQSQGDKQLWVTMRDHYQEHPTAIPPTWDKLRLHLHQTFQQLTHHQLEEEEAFYAINGTRTGIKNSDMVTPTWWYNTAMPIIMDRAAALGYGLK